MEVGFTNRDIMMRHGVKNQGGIRKSNMNQCMVLVINDKVKKYSDVSHSNFFDIEYQGEYIRGNRKQVLKYGNKQLSECGDMPLHVYMRMDTVERRYVYMGEYRKNGEYSYECDKTTDRYVYKFPIRKKTEDVRYSFDSFEY